jgi:hypothetical protein
MVPGAPGKEGTGAPGFHVESQFLGYEQALIINASVGMSETRHESALRTDFELAQQLCSDQS